jgi:hypothetical protein
MPPQRCRVTFQIIRPCGGVVGVEVEVGDHWLVPVIKPDLPGQYQRLMDHWRRVLPIPMLEVRDEDLIADQAGVSRQLIETCGLAWDDRCLAFHKTERVVMTASYSQVRQPIYANSIGRWRRYEQHLGPLRDVLGPQAG